MPAKAYRPASGDVRRLMQHFGVAEAQVRRDFVISWMLSSIAGSAPGVVFLGGTALSRTVLPSLRLSEDIDLMPQEGRAATATAIHKGLCRDLARGFGQVTWDVALPDTRHPHASSYRIGGHDVRIQLVESQAYPWPHAPSDLVQRFVGAPAARLETLTPAGFVAAKTAAWCERNTARDLYDLWALADAGHIDQKAADVFRKLGPTGRVPSAAVMPAQPPSEAEWVASLGHQCRLQVNAKQAHTVVLRAWTRLSRS